MPNPDGDFSTASYMGCLKQKIIDFISRDLQKLLEKMWKEAAIPILKIVGENAVRGGVVSLAKKHIKPSVCELYTR
ncbi:hypothetical protein P9738_07765 [Bacillus siamensis]|uniref:hypothetical protein n=1 Tax=Bacillus siamensis TaxID=659243 RepID=UPI002E1B8DE9|nr:hypothetical protein [Bacillus siamensis]MED5096165.1 hypothetical protein [Bacillus siamensis]